MADERRITIIDTDYRTIWEVFAISIDGDYNRIRNIEFSIIRSNNE